MNENPGRNSIVSRDATTPNGRLSSGEVSREARKRPGFARSAALPVEGGGAVRGIGEKFAVNPATGAVTLTVPIATSPGRSGFGPQLSLAYDSGAGNGPFGFGGIFPFRFTLSIPSIANGGEVSS